MSLVRTQQRSFPVDWDVLAFEDALVDMTGGNPKVQTREYQGAGLLPVIDQGQSPVAGYVDDLALACKGPFPCILFGDHTRIFKYAERSFALGADGVKVLVPRPGLDARFAFHYLRTVRLPEDLGYSRHFKHLREAPIPRPPMAEQRRIADILDKADAIRRKRKEAIALTEELLRSAFLEMFGDPVTNPKRWPRGTIGTLLTLKSGEFLPAKQMDTAGAFAVYGGNGINGRHSKFMFDAPMLTIGRVGVYCGVVHRTEPKSWVTDNALFVAKFSDDLTPTYLEHALRVANLNQYASQSAQPLISGGRLAPVELLVPSELAQERFASFVRAHRAATTSQDRGGGHADELFKTLVARAFSGELEKVR